MKRLFEIPVYTIAERHFLQTHGLLKLNNLPCRDEDTTCVNPCAPYYPKDMWRFNNITGYIAVLIDNNKKDICFEVYKDNPENLADVGKTERWFKNIMCTGQHFRYSGLSNEEIRNRIRKFIEGIEAEFFSEMYADLEPFNNLIGFVDFNKI